MFLWGKVLAMYTPNLGPNLTKHHMWSTELHTIQFLAQSQIIIMIIAEPEPKRYKSTNQ